MTEAPQAQSAAVTALDPAARPAARADAVQRAMADFIAACEAGDMAPPEDRARLEAAFAASDFIARVALQAPAAVHSWLADGADAGRDAGAHRDALAAALGEDGDNSRLGAVLRRYRAVESARIAWRDLFALAPIDTILVEQTALAEACIGFAAERLEAAARARHGVPRDPAGQAQSLLVLGMGKLGGGELNFSSDVDLIFLYGAGGETDGVRGLENRAFFTRLGQELIQALDARTPEGFVYRVDMRLRPFGGSGPLAIHLAQLEQYLLTQAREWERFALVKARPLTGDAETIADFEALRRPFVFRRYLDFGAFEALRDLKARLQREVARKGLERDVKYGRGGIREIEFIAQAFQLIRGGREARLRTRGLLAALECLADNGDLAARVVDELAAAYRYLRRVENRLQLFNDERVHGLPGDDALRERLAWTMGAQDWPAFRRQLDGHMQAVHRCFNEVFNVPEDEQRPREPLAAAWEDGLRDELLVERLASAGYRDAAAVGNRLQALRDGVLYRSLSATARTRFDRLLPMLLADAAGAGDPERTLGRLLTLVEAIAGRSVYLSLLAEHDGARQRLVDLCGASPWIAEFLTGHPILLDELLDPDSLYEVPQRETVEAEVETALDALEADDLEGQMDALRRIRQVNVLRVAAVDISGTLPVMRVSDILTMIAEVMLAAVHRLAWQQMTARHGRPTVRTGGDTVYPGLGIVAYGKMGGLELGYGSDLDLVFLHDGDGEAAATDGSERPLDNGAFFGRLAQRIVHMLNTVTPAGVLYEIDTRLRPNGSSGLLVSPIAAFERYQREHAWTWEHQALTRARMIVGEADLQERFRVIREGVLTRERDADTLRTEVVAMRDRMYRELANRESGRFDLKQGRGGVADIEFMVQYAVLSQAAAIPALVRYTDNMRQIETLAEAGVLDADAADTLAEAYRTFRGRVHRFALLGEPAVIEPDADTQRLRAAVIALWDRTMTGTPDAGSPPVRATDS